MTAPLVEPLLDLPDSIRRIGFLEALSEAIEIADWFARNPPGDAT